MDIILAYHAPKLLQRGIESALNLSLIHILGLRQQYRGQGLGRKLLEVALRRAQAFGFTRVELDVRVPNIRAINLYMQVGFRPVGTIKNGVTIDGVSEDVLQMRLDFPSGRMMD